MCSTHGTHVHANCQNGQVKRPRSCTVYTGTPIQNDLSEFHAVFDVACPGLLGDANEFRRKVTHTEDKFRSRVFTPAARRQPLREPG